MPWEGGAVGLPEAPSIQHRQRRLARPIRKIAMTTRGAPLLCDEAIVLHRDFKSPSCNFFWIRTILPARPPRWMRRRCRQIDASASLGVVRSTRGPKMQAGLTCGTSTGSGCGCAFAPPTPKSRREPLLR
jgi:hypothetical protein